MVKRIESRLRALEGVKVPEAPVFLTRDEMAVYAIATIGMQARELEARQSRGEPLAAASPELEARRDNLLPLLLRFNERVGELREHGQLETVVESIRTKGAWRDEWNDQEPVGEAGSNPA